MKLWSYKLIFVHFNYKNQELMFFPPSIFSKFKGQIQGFSKSRTPWACKWCVSKTYFKTTWVQKCKSTACVTKRRPNVENQRRKRMRAFWKLVSQTMGCLIMSGTSTIRESLLIMRTRLKLSQSEKQIRTVKSSSSEMKPCQEQSTVCCFLYF